MAAAAGVLPRAVGEVDLAATVVDEVLHFFIAQNNRNVPPMARQSTETMSPAVTFFA